MGNSSEKQFVVSYSKLKLVGLAASSFAMTLACLAGLEVFGDNPWPRDLDYPILGWGMVILFAGATVRLAYLSLTANEAYRVDNAGLTFANGQLLPWSVVKSTKVWTLRLRSSALFPVRQRFIVMDVDPGWNEDVSRLGGALREMETALTGGSHSLAASGMDRSFDELVAGFNQFAPDHLKVQL